uniref:NADH-ubiquinone oxidoreductase chain 4 n=1 Tax=Crioceris duodecimpunctata TaxID=184539 RepID=Q8WB13_CRIDU|nr:NADH dehydrogenase subunit 4 [Crioceris duodecimpunctata]AAL67869.1 NADH dehydrogenase subunit 4 [Crioceris duodecimpunctata]
MMKFYLGLIFLSPLCFKKNYWLLQWMFLFMSFLFIFEFNFSLNLFSLSYYYGYDSLSYYLVLLSFWICSLMIMASEKLLKEEYYYKIFMFLLICLMLVLFLTFVSLNFFIFYLFFEISLIPVLFLIIGWGYQPERIEAGLYLLFYTLLMSLPMMVGIFFYYYSSYHLIFYLMSEQSLHLFMYLCINMVFFCKIPMFFIHLWLPKAHVEAPVSGSMILAGIMLKLGGYGLMRFMPMFMSMVLNIGVLLITLSLIGGFFVSLICLRQSDIKSLIAYSSVAHMSLLIGGLMSMSLWGYYGSLMMMIAHGLCSSGLFCLANITYERLMSRSLYLSKGLLNIFPSLAFWWFMLLIGNMAAPLTLNLFSEIMLINSLISYSNFCLYILILLSFFSAVYSLYLYSFSQHGAYYSGLMCTYQIYFREFLLLFMHWLPLNLLFLKKAFILFI